MENDDGAVNIFQSENKYFGKYMAEKTCMELAFLDGEILRGRIRWYDDVSIGIINELQEQIYIDKRALKWGKPVT